MFLEKWGAGEVITYVLIKIVWLYETITKLGISGFFLQLIGPLEFRGNPANKMC